MIELNTGVPGSGKTLSMVQDLSKLVARWEKHPEEARPIFVHGIPNLLLPHSPMPCLSVSSGQLGVAEVVPDWSAMPDGSLVFIDECQCAFPPRSAQSKAPPHVAWLNVHRHRGFDIRLTTQHPKLMDGSVRALIGKHKHFRRLFGGNRAVVYEFDACNDSLGGLKNAVTSYWSYPKTVYKFYKSAEVHTRQKFKLPLWLGIPLVGVALGVFFVPRAASVLSNGISGKGTAGAAASASSASALVSPALPGQTSDGVSPSVLPAPVPVSVLPVAVAAVVYQGCYSTASTCKCLSLHGFVDTPEGCRDGAIGQNNLVRRTVPVVDKTVSLVRPSVSSVPVIPASVPVNSVSSSSPVVVFANSK